MTRKANYYSKIRESHMLALTIIILGSFFLIPLKAIAASEKVNFSGEWTFNKAKSNTAIHQVIFLGAFKLLQKGNELTIERLSMNRDGQEMKSTEKYTLDGKECENTTRNRTRKSIVTWSEDGNSITISSKMVFDRNGQTMEIKIIEIWKLEDGGKSLSIESSHSTPMGERKATLIYDKQ